MSYLETIADKPVIVIDIGYAYTKCGYAGETGPHSIIPTKITKGDKSINIFDYKSLVSTEPSSLANEIKEEECLKEMLIEFLYRIYYKILNSNSRERKIVIVESILTPFQFRKVLAEVLFKNFQAYSVLFIPNHLAALYTLGSTAGLVLDCGYSDCQIMPIAEGLSMNSLCDFVDLGGRRLHKEIKELLQKYAFVSCNDKKMPFAQVKPEPELTEDILEDIKIRCCFVTPFERAQKYYKEIKEKHLADGTTEGVDFEFAPSIDYNLSNNYILNIPGYVREMALEVLFVDKLDSQQTIPNLILNSILKCPIDLKKELAENVVLIGGTCMLNGFKNRLVKEINHILDQQSGDYANKFVLKSLKYHQPPSMDNYTAWLGGAIFGSLDILDSSSLLNMKYKELEKLPDWFTITQKNEMVHI